MAKKLHRDAVLQSLQGCSVAFDGLEIVAAIPLDGPGVRLDFRFHYLDGPEGYSVGPSRLMLRVNEEAGAGGDATFAYGLTQPEGKFWYPSTSKGHDWFIPPSEYNWAFEWRRPIGLSSLAQWRAANRKK